MNALIGPPAFKKRNAMISRRSWNWVVRNIVLPLGDIAYKQRMMERLSFLEKAQWWEPERLHKHRDSSLSVLMKVAYEEVPFYRSLMDKARVRPEQIRRVEDLQRIPIVTKDMLRAGYPHLTTRNTGF